MPTYEYACTACAEHIEVVQRFTDASLTECPSCAGRLRKVFSPVGVVFKGSGFYKTDSRSSTSKPTGKSDSKSDSKSDAKSGSKSDGAPAGDSGASTKSPDSSSPSGTSTSSSSGSTAVAG
ncbi:MAG TPA: FmdB family zinc ribbon protein [Mycobacteriales bacterium]|nr:FmdB family zinc ribbon protein [Mycobacteriales bacterium]